MTKTILPLTSAKALKMVREVRDDFTALEAALAALEQGPLSSATKDRISSLSLELTRSQAGRLFDRILDELGAVSKDRVDWDVLDVPHGAIVLFRVAKGDDSSEVGRLVARFMKDHKKIEILSHDHPGGTNDYFHIRGAKADRLQFQNDVRLPKLLEALEDIYGAEYLPGYASSRTPREIKDSMRHVFGS